MNDSSSPDPTAPDLDAWLRIAFVGLPSKRLRSALQRFDGPRGLLLEADSGRDDELLDTQGITPNVIERLREATARDLEPAYRAMHTHNIRLITQTDDEYSPALRSIGEDAPPFLFVRGDLQPRDTQAVAIVGTRGASEYGRGLAERLSADLVRRGITVVSGLARGIDTHAHEGALSAGGRTIAVCGCGLDIAYPPQNRDLATRIAASGACVSEFAPTTHPETWHFPARNRIISGLSLGVIVVEANERSGALITSDFALEHGREVFAVPGNVHRAQSRGPHALIRNGATLIENVDDVISVLNSRSMPFDVPKPQFVEPTNVAEVARSRQAKSVADVTKINASRAPKQRTSPARSVPKATPPTSNGDSFATAEPTSAPSQVASLPSSLPELTPEQNAIYSALDAEPRHLDFVAERANVGAAEAAATLVLLELRGLARRQAGGLFSRIV